MDESKVEKIPLFYDYEQRILRAQGIAQTVANAQRRKIAGEILDELNCRICKLEMKETTVLNVFPVRKSIDTTVVGDHVVTALRNFFNDEGFSAYLYPLKGSTIISVNHPKVKGHEDAKQNTYELVGGKNEE